MSVIADKAQAVVDDVNQPTAGQALVSAGSAAGDLLTSIISIITSLIGGLQLCGKTPAAGQQALANPGPLERVRLHRQVRRHVRHAGLQPAVEGSILTVAAGVTVPEVEAMYGEVQAAAQAGHDVHLEAAGDP